MIEPDTPDTPPGGAFAELCDSAESFDEIVAAIFVPEQDGCD